MRAQLLPRLAAKFALFSFCSLLTLVALYRLLREQRRLHELNAASRRSLHQAASALSAIEERVLVSDGQGRLAYLNPRPRRCSAWPARTPRAATCWT
ncbi:hypothetical protein I0E98_11075 [Pseudomonas lalucatii]|nr:hypothetical protein [Pseudomonas lalucatii]